MGEGRARAWAIVVLVLSFVPIAGVFTTHNVFFVRDLTFFFWSRHLWLRHTLAAGHAPWWDPYLASGQSAIADALNQLLMPLTMAIRLLPSDVVSFNLWIALPVPIAALGTFLFLRRRTADQAAALGACTFALSGPIVSMLNTPNLAWSVACLPWVLICVQRVVEQPSARRAGTFAAVFALQALSGEPVTWVATGVLALGYAFVEDRRCRLNADATNLRGKAQSGRRKKIAAPSSEPGRRRLRVLVTVVGALGAGALLAAGQLVPTVMAGIRAHRALIATPDFWSLHPLALWEMLVPNLFGNYYDAFVGNQPWMGALNFGRDPFFYSLYVGPLALLLASVAMITRFRRNVFWVVVGISFLLAALGGYTPAYPLLRKLIPQLMYFRFPVKYIVFSIFACAVLVAEGWAAVMNLPSEGGRDESEREQISTCAMWLGVAVSVVLLVAMAMLFMPATASRVAYVIAVNNHLKDPAAGAVLLARIGPPLVVRSLALLLAGCALLLMAAHERGRRAAVLLFVATCASLAFTTRGLNPITDVEGLAPPPWYTAAAGTQRLYVGGRVRGFMNKDDPDAAPKWQVPAAATAVEGRMMLNAELPMAPSGWGVREALSYDLPFLWPTEYDTAVRQFEVAGRDERAAFLRRAGVRLCVMPASEVRQWRVIAQVPDWNMAVFECDAGATRVFFASSVEIDPDPDDSGWQREALFNPAFADDVARLSKRPEAPDRAGPPAISAVRILEDASTTVTVEAATPKTATLVLRDSYDPSWTADIDGAPAEIVRANGLYRAVTVSPGRHVIRFAYRPRDLRTGLIISGTTALMLLLLAFFNGVRPAGRRRDPASRDAGFTLIELMVVLAIIGILLAISFSEYRGMEARGNDASALASMRSIAVAQSQFAMTCGNLKYATNLPALAKPVPATGQGFLSPDLTQDATFEKSGYRFQMTAKPTDGAPPACNGEPVADGYAATADPIRAELRGVHFYGVNADRVLYMDEDQTFTGNLPETGAPPHGGEVK